MTAQLCQSVSWPQNGTRKVGPYPIGAPACRHPARAVLFGIHLCQFHDRSWRPRLQAGQKIKVHAERTLPLPAAAPVTVPSKRCSKCGETKAATEANFGLTRLGHLRSWCRPCERAYQAEHYRKRHGSVANKEPSARQLPIETRPVALPLPERVDARPPGGADDPPVLAGPPAPVEPKSPRAHPGHQALGRRGVRPPAEISWPPQNMRTPTGAVEAWDKQLGAARPVPTLQPPVVATAAPVAQPDYVYDVEFACALCGRHVCTAMATSEKTPIRLPSRVRCQACGGNPLRGEATRRYVGPSGRELLGGRDRDDADDEDDADEDDGSLEVAS